MPTSPSSKSYAYQSSWNWVALALIRGFLSALLLMGLVLLVARQGAAPLHPWGYALRMVIPLGLITVFPTVALELWAVQRKASWLILALLFSNIVNQAVVTGYSAIGLWLRYQMIQLLQHPSLWLGVLFPPLLFATAAIFRITFPRRQGFLVLLGLLLGNLIFWFVRPGNPSPIRGFFFLLALVVYAYRVSDNLLSLFWPYHRLWPRDHPSYTLPLSKRPPLIDIFLMGGRNIVGWLQFNFLVGFVGWMLPEFRGSITLFVLWLIVHLWLSVSLPTLYHKLGLLRRARDAAEYRLTSPWHPNWERSALLRIMQQQE